VLPFASADPGDSADRAAIDGTADALYDRLTQSLSSIPGLYVIAPSTASVYADADLTPEQIAFYLGVRGVIQGRVDTDGERVSL
jgi:TolB-like protein